ncbi:hypothetical protein GWK36_09020 [Caldichromatium japonicum]|uniref:Uncharacterized protein n=1 Tax=Caldichromatium japonicum TaxID=2699430 RepID=A0A6G7VDQ8_9GAMM|nr:hypothetical protein [Caldichromatium japonicum]QIK38104.1 hypothetical protein GWK36_09020 [Caldichromatium japonicum]
MCLNEAFDAIQDLRACLADIIARYAAPEEDDAPHRTWRLPDGALLTCDPPLTREEVADIEDCDPEDIEPVGA